jgi:hypothetical protein
MQSSYSADNGWLKIPGGKQVTTTNNDFIVTE